MKKINEQEMMNVHGGAILSLLGKIALAALGVSFLGGVVDGFLRPLKCN